MINPRLTAAIHTFYAADALIPATAADDVMDAAVSRAADALDRVRRIPALYPEEAGEKLVLSDRVAKSWPTLSKRLRETAELEVQTWLCNERLRAA